MAANRVGPRKHEQWDDSVHAGTEVMHMTIKNLGATTALLAGTLALSACARLPPPAMPTAGATATQPSGQFEFGLPSGEYRCEHGERLHLQREVANAVNHRIQLAWNGTEYQLERDPSYSGLPRFEDSTKGLVWIDLPWKGLLLDGRTHKPLVNECRAT